MLHVHTPHRQSLRDRLERRRQQARPGREQVRERRGSFEVRRKGESSARDQHALCGGQ